MASGVGRLGVIKQRQADEEARAFGGVAFGADGAAVFLDDLGGDGEAEAGAAVLGGVEGQEEPLADFFGESVAGVRDGDLNGGAVFGERTAHAEDAEQAALHGLGGVVDEVGEGAADGLGIGEDQRAGRVRGRA